ncbi:hypothetical protein OAJ52_01035 [Bacteroidia bacterium]|nr:hypothetical protein [Bacteroidia bacterium]
MRQSEAERGAKSILVDESAAETTLKATRADKAFIKAYSPYIAALYLQLKLPQ